jgi:hypothetical protein
MAAQVGRARNNALLDGKRNPVNLYGKNSRLRRELTS